MQTEEILEEKIVELLKKENKALSAFEIEELLELKKEEFTTLIKTLNQIVDEINNTYVRVS